MDNFHRKKSRRKRKLATIVISKNNIEKKFGFNDKPTKYINHGIINKKKNKIIERRFSTIFRKKSNYQDILKILASQKEREKEKIRQKIIYKNAKNYAKNICYNYYVMLISNLITNKPNIIKYKYIELLNLIETKELLSHFYNKYESRIKLVYLTKLISKNTRNFPNYLVNPKIYFIMINHIIKKENMILHAEKNIKINNLKAQLSKYTKKEKKNFVTLEKAIESFTDTESINIENKLFDFEINESFNYSSSSDNDSISRVQNLIDDISLLLEHCEKNQNNKSIIVKKSSKKIKKIRKNFIRFKSKDFESNTLKSIKEKEYDKKHEIIKMNTLTKFTSFNKNKILNFEELILNNIYQRKLSNNSDKYNKKKIKNLSSFSQNKEIEKTNKSKSKFNSTFKKDLFPPKQNTKDNNHELYLNTNKNTNTINNMNNIEIIKTIKTMKSIKNANPIKLEKIANTERENNKFSHFKPTNNFLRELYKKKNSEEDARIKKSIVKLINKFGKDQYEDSKIKFKKYIDPTYGTLSNEKLLFENNHQTKNKDKKDIRIIKDRNLVGNYVFFDNPNSNRETEYHYSDMINSEKKHDIMWSKSRTSRIDLNYKAFIIPKLNKKKLTENKVISNSEKANRFFKYKLKFDEYKDCLNKNVDKIKSEDKYKMDYNRIKTLNNEIKLKYPNILKLRTKADLNNGINHFKLDKKKIFNLFKNE